VVETHPIKRKLKSSIVPPLILARKLNRKGYYIVQLLYTYTNELAAFFIGAGVISSDFFGFMSKSDNLKVVSPAVISSRFYLPLIAVMVVWAFVKAYVKLENTQKKFEFARACRRKLKSFESKLDPILSQDNPLPDMEELRKNIESVLDATIDADAYTFDDISPKYQKEIDGYFNQLCSQYEQYWKVNVSNIERIEK
jgi:hypothetical protein